MKLFLELSETESRGRIYFQIIMNAISQQKQI